MTRRDRIFFLRCAFKALRQGDYTGAGTFLHIIGGAMVPLQNTND